MVLAAMPVLDSIAEESLNSEITSLTSAERNFAPRLLSIESIRPNPKQARRRFDDEAMKRLADSLRTHGALQPILVRPMRDPALLPRHSAHAECEPVHELVAGERR